MFTANMPAGLVCLVGLKKGDQKADADVCARKILNSRLFNDQDSGAMWKKSVMDVRGEVLCVSQFTLYGRVKSSKPDFSRALGPGEVRMSVSRVQVPCLHST